MKAVGLITEYNPFHKGHLHHLRESLRTTGADVAVAVMSGHFLQRGEPALVDKWCRAQMAVECGVDLVVELPLPWACSSAPSFAEGGVKALDALGGVSALCFGSESGELGPLELYAEILQRHEQEIEQNTARLLKQGVTYPQARAEVLTRLLPAKTVAEGLASPNNILGIEYLKALRQQQSHIKAATIQRVGAGYHDSSVRSGEIASATGIRRCLRDGKEISAHMPEQALSLLRQSLGRGEVLEEERYFVALMSRILSQGEDLSDLGLVENGIENRLLGEADCAVDLESLIEGIKTRQLTRTRIQRMLVAVLLGLKKCEMEDLLSAGPGYLHLLAASTKGQAFLASGRKQRSLPLIQNFSRIYAGLKRFYGADSAHYRLASLQLKLELKATRMYTVFMKEPWRQHRNRDFYQPLIRTGVTERRGRVQ